MVMQSAKLMISSVLENVICELPERNQLTLAQQKDIACRLLVKAGAEHLIDALDKSVIELSLENQRRLAILREIAVNPKALFIDEPTTGLDEDDASRLLGYIKEEAKYRAIVVVLHNQQHARFLDGVSVLMAGGWIQETAPTSQLFDSPTSVAAIEFARNGTCAAPSPDTRPEELDPECPVKQAPVPEEARFYKSDVFGPRGFLWLKKGILAGTPFPGIVADEDQDLEALQRVGITHLITLTEERKPIEATVLAEYGITCSWKPFADMGVPTVNYAISICELIDQLIRYGHAIAVHCKAGLGRTGTVLALYLIWEGESAPAALETVRRVEPRWVQSEQQVKFLEEFADALANGNGFSASV